MLTTSSFRAWQECDYLKVAINRFPVTLIQEELVSSPAALARSCPECVSAASSKSPSRQLEDLDPEWQKNISSTKVEPDQR